MGVLFYRWFLCIFIAVFLVISGVSAMAGVRPSSYTVDFQPNLKNTFTFQFLSDDSSTFDTYVEGDLAQYVTISTSHLPPGAGTVEAKLNLPSRIDVPGVHKIFIGAKEVLPAEQGVGLAANTRGVIFVNVPYPGRYAEISLSVDDANVGEDTKLVLAVTSKGEEPIDTDSRIDIYSNDSGFIETIPLGHNEIQPEESISLEHTLATKSYKPGDYRAVAHVLYNGNDATQEVGFRLGELSIEIANYTSIVRKNIINRFLITAKSHWNNNIDNVYADVHVLDQNIEFKTPSVSIARWDQADLEGFLDTTTLSNSSSFVVQMDVHYNDKVTTKKARIRFVGEKDYTIYFVLAGVLVAIIVLVLIAMLIRIITLEKGVSKNGKKRKK